LFEKRWRRGCHRAAAAKEDRRRDISLLALLLLLLLLLLKPHAFISFFCVLSRFRAKIVSKTNKKIRAKKIHEQNKWATRNPRRRPRRPEEAEK
jgi:hypothetical protein